MNNEKMGKFICDMRKSQKLTQKDLAEKLKITDKAVSKWERGISCPDISAGAGPGSNHQRIIKWGKGSTAGKNKGCHRGGNAALFQQKHYPEA